MAPDATSCFYRWQVAVEGDRQVCTHLIERFGTDRMMDSISVRDAEEWQRWLSTDGNKRDLENKALQGNTVRRRTGTARQIFATAIRWKLLRDNPFAGFGHSPAVAARFYAQARTEVADRASQERTLSDTLVGTTVGTIGSEMGTIGANHETSKSGQECIETQQKEGSLRVSDGVERAADIIN